MKPELDEKTVRHISDWIASLYIPASSIGDQQKISEQILKMLPEKSEPKSECFGKVTGQSIEKFMEHYKHDNCDDMNEEQWGEWVNALTQDEFLAMISIGFRGKV